jgi:hypothetical protein
VTTRDGQKQVPLEDVFFAIAQRFDPYTAAYMLQLGINRSTAQTKFTVMQRARAAAAQKLVPAR